MQSDLREQEIMSRYKMSEQEGVRWIITGDFLEQIGSNPDEESQSFGQNTVKLQSLELIDEQL